MTPLAKHILDTLNAKGFEAFIVGGYVRDTLMGREPKDLDIVTNAIPEEITTLFPDAETVGEHFGVALVRGLGECIQVATYRGDGAYKDADKPLAVRFTTVLQEDLERRDFTFNTFTMNADGHIDDLLGGTGALFDRQVVAVGQASARFREDPVRILRAVRFACVLDFHIAPRTYGSMIGCAPLLLTVAPERLQSELSLILTSGQAARGLDLLRGCGALQYILPEIERMAGVQQNPTHHPEGDVYEHTKCLLEKLEKGCSLTLALAALLHDVGKPLTQGLKNGQPTFYDHESVGATVAVGILSRLRYSNEVCTIVRSHVEQHMRFRVAQEMAKSKLLRFLRLPHFDELLALHKLDALSGSGNLDNAHFVEGVLAETPIERISPPRLVTGKDLLEFGLQPGPQIGELLTTVETKQLEGEITTREQALAFLRETAGALEIAAL